MLVHARTERVGRQAGRSKAPRRGSSIPYSRGCSDIVRGTAYDSDSFENHVIDLREWFLLCPYRGLIEACPCLVEAQAACPCCKGDEEQSTSYEKETAIETEKDSRNIHSDEMTVDKALNARESWIADSDIESDHKSRNRDFLNGTGTPGHERGTLVKNMFASINDSDLSSTQHQEFFPGQLVWAKFARFPWWPAQVMDDKDAVKCLGRAPGLKTDVLVRYFGTYDYGWVDPYVNLSDFDVKFSERRRVRKKALQKGVEEALEFRISGTLPLIWVSTNTSVEEKTEEPTHCNGTKECDNGIKVHQVAEPEPRRAPRKRKPKVLFEEESRVQRKPEKGMRRIRIMRQLGLVAPAGSIYM